MKKILSLIGTITLIGTSTTSLVACNKIHDQYTPEELKELKEKNKINTKDETIKNNLEWIAPQEKPFNEVDNKWYYVLWRGDKNDDWKIVKFKHKENKGLIEDYNNFIICINKEKELYIFKKQGKIGLSQKWNKNDDYFKAVYRWNLTTQEPNLIIDNKGNIKVNGE
ncbi:MULTISPECIES: lipoprotein [unclassified Spiroplasma]|uniref:lipoprotein n=1 Tax=unclassified Spiroplasma TaxID=2637901 RepID=UPI0030D61450